jgi:predicted O-methyltransferase YrrM
LELILPAVQAYAERFTSPEDALLRSIVQYTQDTHPQAQMLSGHLQGRLLSTISAMLRPRRILEIGTFTGYSALCLAEGLAPGGELHTIELRESEATTARHFFQQSAQAAQIILHTGNALEIIPALAAGWDLVFIDADKTGYIDYYEMVLPRLNDNGIILADNVLFHGDVLGDTPNGKNGKAVHAFNNHVCNDERVTAVLLTIRDGLMMIRKK